MTGGRVVVIGRTGRNFAAGMSGGVAYVLDEDGDFRAAATSAWSTSSRSTRPRTSSLVRDLIRRHVELHRSAVAAGSSCDWAAAQPRFVKVMPRDYKRVLGRDARAPAPRASRGSRP